MAQHVDAAKLIITEVIHSCLKLFDSVNKRIVCVFFIHINIQLYSYYNLNGKMTANINNTPKQICIYFVLFLKYCSVV